MEEKLAVKQGAVSALAVMNDAAGDPDPDLTLALTLALALALTLTLAPPQP